MKLLFTISLYLPYISGLTLAPARLAEALAKRGYKISILTTQHKKAIPKYEIINRVNITRVPYDFRISKGFIMLFYFWFAFREVRKANIVIINLPQFEGFIPALFAKLLGKKVVCIYSCEVKLPETILNKIIENILQVSNYFSLLFSDKIITYTKDYANHSKLLPSFNRKLLLIPPAIPEPQIDKLYTLKLQNSLYCKDKYVMGMVGRIAAEKGIEYLIKTIPYLIKNLDKNFIIIFVGPKEPVGEKKYSNKLKSLINEYQEYLIFLGEVPANRLGSVYNILDVLVLPSINSTEAFGMVQVEAMLCGIPVVASNLPGVRVPIQETGMGEIANLRDSKDLADKIIKVLTNKKKYVKDKKTIAKIFKLDDTINMYEKLFKYR